MGGGPSAPPPKRAKLAPRRVEPVRVSAAATIPPPAEGSPPTPGWGWGGGGLLLPQLTPPKGILALELTPLSVPAASFGDTDGALLLEVSQQPPPPPLEKPPHRKPSPAYE